MVEKDTNKRKSDASDFFINKKLKKDYISDSKDVDEKNEQIKLTKNNETDDNIVPKLDDSYLNSLINDEKINVENTHSKALENKDKDVLRNDIESDQIKKSFNEKESKPVNELTPLDQSKSFTSNNSNNVTESNLLFGKSTFLVKTKHKIKNKEIFDVDFDNKKDNNNSKCEIVDNLKEIKKSTYTFGSNSNFNNAFENSLKKKSFLDQESTTQSFLNNDKPNGLNMSSLSSSTNFKLVDLKPIKKIQTGEENEICLFITFSKLFELNLNKIEDGWKERGIGSLHLNQSKLDKSKLRLLMRSQSIFRLILNHRLNENTELLKGLESSLTPGKYLRFNSLKDDNTPIQYLLKFKSEIERDKLYDKIIFLQNEWKNNDSISKI